MTRIAFIGLGVMGGPIARHLKQAGHDLTVYNRSRAKAEKWVEAYGGTLATSPADAAKDAEKEIQDLTDRYIVLVDKHLAAKEKEMMAV
jgi:3-hydroxyisobutyrate dehydrogenase-like beta-hydroxyacid dehydrogenase